ncbi:hypothetical protein Efla_001121 [Eimeria flavescens]
MKAVQLFLGKCQYYRRLFPTCLSPLHLPFSDFPRNPYDGGEPVVASASRSLLEDERHWTATELEATALVWALETFRHHFEGVKVFVRTDYASLEYSSTKKSRCRRLERWAGVHSCALRAHHEACITRSQVFMARAGSEVLPEEALTDPEQEIEVSALDYDEPESDKDNWEETPF